MSVSAFFAYPTIKQAVIEFLKCRSDINLLHSRYKKPFRAHINRHTSHREDFFVSDGFNSIKCQFTPACTQLFTEQYPSHLQL